MPMPYRLWIAGLVMSALAPGAAAAFDSDHPAALVTFPYVVVNPSQGVDTRLRLVNTDDELLDVVCGLENTTAHCESGARPVCDTTSDCPIGVACVPDLKVSRFAFQLAAGQPIGWPLSTGATLPLAQNGDPIPAAPESPMRGVLRCFAAHPDGSPSARNALVGEAVVERAGETLLDVASYNAVGAQAHAAGLNDDRTLVLGGANGEYDACPQTVSVNHLFDLAHDPIAISRSLQTTLVFTRCNADLSRENPQNSGAVLQFLVHNEFEQRFSTSNTFVGQMVSPMSLIDTRIPDRSIFSATITGTLSGSTTIRAVGGSVMGLALEKRLGSDPTQYSTAAYNLHSSGQPDTPAEIKLDLRCPGRPRPDCRRARRSRLMLSDRARRRVAWEWKRGELLNLSEIGDPDDGTAIAICLYANDEPRASIVLPPDAPNWRRSRDALTFADKSGSFDGTRTITVTPANHGRGRVTLRAVGERVPALDLDGDTAAPVVIQLLNDRTGICLESVFEPDEVIEDSPHLFDARSVVPE
ncbi:MAG: hypothetical protein SF182_10610 [Deltaproteobacteria bacterium]|nr:hypothetical protein [Deltaproteobacteria bacterium]